jgi:hypothetical protein
LRLVLPASVVVEVQQLTLHRLLVLVALVVAVLTIQDLATTVVGLARQVRETMAVRR